MRSQKIYNQMLEVDAWRDRLDVALIFQCIYFLDLSGQSLSFDALLTNLLNFFICFCKELCIPQLLFFVFVHQKIISIFKKSHRMGKQNDVRIAKMFQKELLYSFYNKSQIMEADYMSKIDISTAFKCKQCNTIALQPLQNECCTIIICEKCVGPQCYHCKKICNYRRTPFLQHLYKCISVKCPYKCKNELSLFMLKSHIAVCLEATMECPYCKEKNIKTALFPQHMGVKHQEECSRLLIEFHKERDGKDGKVEAKVEAKSNPFRVGISGNPRICKNGRLVCGGELGVMVRSSGLFNSQTKLFCSLETGSCNQCMRLDRQRFGLPINCLLNFEGRICYYAAAKKKLGCGIGCGANGNPFICNAQYSCPSCVSTCELIQRGLYRELLGI